MSYNVCFSQTLTLKKKHRTIEDQFINPDDDENFGLTSTSTHQSIDELDKYLKMTIPEQCKVSDPFVFCKYHADKFPNLAKNLATSLFYSCNVSLRQKTI